MPRPTSLDDKNKRPMPSVLLNASPSCIDLSGRHEHPPLSSLIGTGPASLRNGLLADLPKPMSATNDQTARGPKRVNPDSEKTPDDIKRRVHTGALFGELVVSSRQPVQGDAPCMMGSSDDMPSDDKPVHPVRAANPDQQDKSSKGQGRANAKISQQSYSLSDSGWKVGAYFRHINRPRLSHRVYDGPPDGTMRDRIGPENLVVDFDRPYKIVALFVNDLYFSVQFKVPGGLTTSGWKSRSRVVWGNMRRGNDWWATLVQPDPIYIQDQEADEDDPPYRSGHGAETRAPWAPN